MIKLVRLEISEDLSFLVTGTILYIYLKTQIFSFTLLTIPIIFACFLRYWIYVINRKQNDCISFIDFVIFYDRLI